MTTLPSPDHVLKQPLRILQQRDEFIHRHIGPDAEQIQQMLQTLGIASLEALTAQALPKDIRLPAALPLPEPCPEQEALIRLRAIANKNQVRKSLIGMGYYGTRLPSVILRNVLENPGWYTAYTPYQAEISQGRLEALMNFQQMVCDLTGMDLANASLLDEATAAAEAMTMARRISKNKADAFFVDENCFPQTIDVLQTRAEMAGIELIIGAAETACEQPVFGALLQYPGFNGELSDLTTVIANIKATGAITAVATDLMALVVLKTPADMGADIALGSAQRFGVPMGFGGPHAAFFATRNAYIRMMPGRIIGISKDSRGRTCYRMTLQTREQHIRREKANSNICTAQALLANLAGFYAVYHGAEGLRAIAARIHRLTALLYQGLKQAGFSFKTTAFFDTFHVMTGERTHSILTAAEQAGYNLGMVSPHVTGIALDETTTLADIKTILQVFGVTCDIATIDETLRASGGLIAPELLRSSGILTHPVFHLHRTEHKMLRYLKKLQDRDLALDHSMIPLGSCTMKLNAASGMIPISWPEFADIHPFAPREQTRGYMQMINELAAYLSAVTGFSTICMQPNSGAQGEYTGLVTIRRYHHSRGDTERNVCLIPRSAHGTNPASAQMCHLEVVVVECDANGNIDIADLRAKAQAHQERLAAVMVTYPSTYGLFEAGIREICEIVHQHGGQVYMDGANLNAQVGLTSPAFIGSDVVHMNLHKTFSIPHGGGGPGVGPIGLAPHLAPFAPDHCMVGTGDESRPNKGQSAVSAAPFGSASILPICWMYITMMGEEGLKQATQTAILNANYIAHQLKKAYPVRFTGFNGLVAHECILDIRPIKETTGISEVDIAKRLMDYGFHAPTVSFPVPGTLMIEPTESESLEELERFIAAMLSIRDEIRQVENNVWPPDNNPLKNAPHTALDLTSDWVYPYSRETAAFALGYIREHKYWPSVNRIDDVYGDRHPFCLCPPLSAYEAD